MNVRLKNPAHPGAFVRTEIIEPLGLSVAAIARMLGVSRMRLSNFLKERTSLSADMAIRIDREFGVDRLTLMRMQGSFDAEKATSHLLSNPANAAWLLRSIKEIDNEKANRRLLCKEKGWRRRSR